MDEQHENIIRYSDNALSPQERAAFASELAAHPELRQEVAVEEKISQILHSDASRLERTLNVDATPSRAILERLAATSPAAKSRVAYYVAGAAVLIGALILFFLLQPKEVSTPDPVASPSAPTTPVTPPSGQQIVPEPTQVLPTTTQQGQSIQAKPTKKTAQKQTHEIDLDKDLGKPKIFNDPKAHMPIDQK